MAPGTVIDIRDLFFNTPARRRFMRTPATEFGHIADTVNRVAMVHPAVGFTLRHNGRTTLHLPPRDDQRQRCVNILGNELEPALLEFSYQDLRPAEALGTSGSSTPQRPARLWGLAGEPSIARSSSKFQYLCVNGRPVRDRNLAHAIKEAYRGLMAPDRQPVAVVFLDLDPALVDVNVHPTKAEVRFRNPSSVHGLVLSRFRQRLLSSDLVPDASLRSSTAAAGFFSKEADAERGFSGGASEASGRPSPSPPPPSPSTPDAFVDYFRRMDPKQKGFVYEEVRRDMAAHDMFHRDGNADPEADAEAGSAAEASGIRPPSSASAPPSPHALASILQFHNSYVVTPDTSGHEPGLLIVDQHALHERIMFEELRQRILVDGKPLESQRLLLPAVVDADATQQALLEDLAPLLTRLGIEIQPLGPAAVGVQAFPTLLFDRGVNVEAFTRELLEKTEAGDLRPQDLSPDAAMQTAEAAAARGPGHDELQGRGQGRRPPEPRRAQRPAGQTRPDRTRRQLPPRPPHHRPASPSATSKNSSTGAEDSLTRLCLRCYMICLACRTSPSPIGWIASASNVTRAIVLPTPSINSTSYALPCSCT